MFSYTNVFRADDLQSYVSIFQIEVLFLDCHVSCIRLLDKGNPILFNLDIVNLLLYGYSVRRARVSVLEERPYNRNEFYGQMFHSAPKCPYKVRFPLDMEKGGTYSQLSEK